jgi:predicted MPP superfamily phosphohydrolase
MTPDLGTLVIKAGWLVRPHLLPLLLVGIGLALGATAIARPWRWGVWRCFWIESLPLLGIFFLFCAADVMLLQSLPRLGLSFGYRWQTSAWVTLVMRSAIMWVVGTVLGLPRLWRHWRGLPVTPLKLRNVVLFTLALNMLFSLAQVDAYMIEPFWLETTPVELSFAKLNPDAPPLRIVHLSDIHVERLTKRERALVEQVNALEPDLILMTGDYLNLSYLEDEQARADFRWLEGQLKSRYGIYATRGSVEPWPQSMARLVEGTQVHWLENEHIALELNGQRITLVGVATSHQLSIDGPRLDQAMAGVPPDAFTILLYHSPDLIEQAAAYDIDLYLGGHTHGGQVRLPFYGALATSSIYGKRYEAGLYRQGNTTMYISRGIGMEGEAAPRARFLCRPEIVYLTLKGQGAR